jgi:hypothetical protein
MTAPTAFVPSPACQPVSDPAELTLHRFGPMGISIRSGPPGVFRFSQRNVIEVVLTNRRLCGVWKPGCVFWPFARRRGQLAFQVGASEILGVEVQDLLATKVVVVRYRQADADHVVSIEAALGCHQHAERLAELLVTAFQRTTP